MQRFIRKIRRWVEGRRRSRLLPALPALLVCVAWVFFAAFIAGWGSAHTEARYRQTASQAISGRDFETARVAYWRLVQLKSENRNEYLFYLALSLFGVSRETEAQGIITTLTPLDAPGYPLAQLFVAKTLLSASNAPPQTAKLAELHLLRAVEADSGMVEARHILGQLYARLGLWDAAQKQLREVVKTRGEAALLLAAVLRSKGEEDDARGWAERSAKFFAEKVANAKADDPSVRISWANSLMMLNDYPAALAIIETGMKQSGDLSYRYALGALYGNWVQSVVKDKPQDLETRFRLVQAGLQYTPQNESLLRELVDLTRLEGAQGQVARDSVKKLLAEGGTASASLHYFLGLDAWQRGKKEEAQQHFSIAFDMAPFMPTVANNMAMILIMGKDTDPERALKIIEPMVQKYPANPYYRSTRGQVLVKLGRCEEAVADLQLALPQMPVKRSIRTSLAEAYQKLGMQDLAQEQTRLAEQGESAPSQPPKASPAPAAPTAAPTAPTVPKKQD